MKITIDIPGISKLSGGIQRMLELHNQLQERGHEVSLHFPQDILLPESDLVITYSDNPHIDQLCLLSKAPVVVYQLSYGMAIDRERKVVNHPNTIICCSTHHIRNKIILDLPTFVNQKHIYYIGHSQESTLENFYSENVDRIFDVASMIHKAPDKRFLEAFEYCKSKNMKIVLFGARNNNFNLSGANKIFLNAGPERIRWIFSRTKKYLSLSISEGLNRPGIEAMLCGCKPYIVEGCELYRNNTNCMFIDSITDFNKDFNILDYLTIKKKLQEYTWKNALKRLSGIIGEEL